MDPNPYQPPSLWGVTNRRFWVVGYLLFGLGHLAWIALAYFNYKRDLFRHIVFAIKSERWGEPQAFTALFWGIVAFFELGFAYYYLFGSEEE